MTNNLVDTIKVLSANSLAGFITLADSKDLFVMIGEGLQNSLSIVSLVLAISYTVWKWKNDITKKKHNIKKYNQTKNK